MTFDDPSRLRLTRRRFQRATAAHPESVGHPTRTTRRIVLTGGPGSGKSTAASFLAREFTGDIWVLPESATVLYRGGMPRGVTDLGTQVAQRAIFSTQRALEQAHELQHPGRVQICDRSTIDGAAYWPSSPDAFFQSMNTTHAAELARYDAVIFMHTAAHMPAGYERDLDVRTEDAELAIELDQRVFELYRDHPRLITIESQVSFLDKLVLVREAVASILGRISAEIETGAAVPTSSLVHLASISADLMPNRDDTL